MNLDWDQAPHGLVIGSSAGADLHLEPGPGVGDNHARLRLRDGQVVIEAADRGHLTEVNGVEIQRAPLVSGDVIRLGRHLLEFSGHSLTPLADRGEVRFHDVSFRYHDRPVLHRLDLLIESRSMIGILGPSGCGKSTLIKAILGEIQPDTGTVETSRHARIGHVPQQDILHASLTVHENLRHRLAIEQPALDQDRILTIIEEVLARCGADLVDARHQRVDALSGGQRRRVNVALELLTTPDILVLDEPTSGLDQASQQAIMELLAALSRRTTVICVTHALETLRDFRTVILLRTLDPRDPGPSIAYHGEADERIMREALGLARLADAFRLPGQHLCVRAPGPPAAPATDLAPAAPAATPDHAPPGLLLGQAWLVLERSARTLARNRLNARLTLLLPALIGLLIFLSQALEPEFGINRVFLVNTHLFAVLAALWLGMTLTVREIVGETAHVRREHKHGLTPLGYLGGKVALGAAVALPQALILVLALLLPHLLAPFGLRLADPFSAPAAVFTLILVLWAMITAGAVVGLVISAVSRSESFAVSLLPLLLIPHLLFNIAAYQDPRGSYHDGAGYNPLATTLDGRRSTTEPNRAHHVHLAMSLPLISRPAVNLLEAAAPTHLQLVHNDDWAAVQKHRFRLEWLHLLALLAAYLIALLLAFRQLGPFQPPPGKPRRPWTPTPG